MTPILLELKWPSVDDLMTERDIAIMHWILFHEQPSVSLHKRVLYRSDASVREMDATDASQLQLPRARTEQARSFYFIKPLTHGTGLRLRLRKPAPLVPHQWAADEPENSLWKRGTNECVVCIDFIFSCLCFYVVIYFASFYRLWLYSDRYDAMM